MQMKRLIGLLLILALSACGKGTQTGLSDDAGLHVLETIPSVDAINVAIDSDIQIRFSKTLWSDAASQASLISVRDAANQLVAGALSVEDNRLIFVPQVALQSASTYTVMVKAGVSAVSGDQLSKEYQWQFTTAAFSAQKPTILFRSPGPWDTNVPINRAVSIGFSNEMNLQTFSQVTLRDQEGTLVSASLGFSNKTLTLDPNNNLLPNKTYRLTLKGLKDTQGNALDDREWSFTTGQNEDVRSPLLDLARSNLVNNKIDVSTKQPLVLAFDERLLAGFLTADNFILQDAGNNRITGQLLFTKGDTVSFVPDQPLSYVTNYTLFIQGVRDLAGNSAVATQIRFTTRAQDTTPPTVSAVLTPNLNAKVLPDAEFRIQFSEELDAATVTTQTARLLNAGGSVVNSAVSLSGDVVIIKPVQALSQRADYRLQLTTGLMDLEGNALAQTYQQTFVTADTTPPQISYHDPATDETDVGITPVITIGFNERLAAESVNSSTVHLLETGSVAVPVGVKLLTSGDIVQLTLPNKVSLKEQTQYTVQVSDQVTDEEGNALASTSWTFTTGDFSAPKALTYFPAKGATGVAQNVHVVLTFDEALLLSSIVGNGVVSSSGGSISNLKLGSDGNTLEFDLTGLAQLMAYTITVTTAVSDAKGNMLDAPLVWSFQTGDFSAPTLVSTSPVSNALTTKNLAVEARFSEKLATSTVTPANVTILPAATINNLRLSQDGTTVLFDLQNLQEQTTYTVTIAKAVTDVAGNPLAANVSWSFKTKDETPPQLSSRTPAVNATGVAKDITITATFNEDMLASSVNDTNVSVLNGNMSVIYTDLNLGSNKRTVTFSLAGLKEKNIYRVQLSTGLKDANGVALANAIEWSFTVGDFTPPTTISKFPENSQTGIVRNASILVTFSEAVLPSTVNASSFQVVAEGAGAGEADLPIAVSYTVSGSSVIVNPVEGTLFPGLKTIRYTISNAITDLANKPLADPTVVRFVTGEFVAPKVTSTALTAGSLTGGQINRRPSYTVTFSEPVSYIGNPFTIIGAGESYPLDMAWANPKISVLVSLPAAVQLTEQKDYSLNIASNLITNPNDSSIQLAQLTPISFTVGDFTPPTAVLGRLSPLTEASYYTNVNPATTNWSVSFNEAMNTAVIPTVSLAGATTTVGTPTWNGDRTLNFTVNGLQKGDYTLNVAGAKDLKANVMTAFAQLVQVGDYVKPIATLETPANIGNVDRHVTTWTMKFNEPMAASLPTVTVSGATVSGISWNNTQTQQEPVLSFNVSGLSDGGNYTLNVKYAEDASINQNVMDFFEVTLTAGDFTAPTATLQMPAHPYLNVNPANNVWSVAFHEVMDTTVLPTVTVSGATVSGRSWNANKLELTFTVTGLVDGTPYTLNVSGAKDNSVNKNLMTPYVQAVATGDYTKPTALLTTPAAYTDVNPATNVWTVTFNEPMNKSIVPTVTVSGATAVNSIAWSISEPKLSFSVVGLVDSTPYTLNVSGGEDLNGNEMVMYSQQVSTGDYTPPTISTITPADGAENVKPNIGSVQAIFSEKVDITNLEVRLDGALISGVTLDNVDQSTLMIPLATLADSALYNLQISGAKDLSARSYPMAVFNSSFTTGDYTGPIVQTAALAFNDVGPSTINVTFNENIQSETGIITLNQPGTGSDISLTAPTVSNKVMSSNTIAILTANTRYRVTISGVKDTTNGTPMAASYVGDILTGSLQNITANKGVQTTVSDQQYVITGLAANSQYLLTMVDGGAATQMSVFGLGNNANLQCTSATTQYSENCLATSNIAGDLYLRVSGGAATPVTLDWKLTPAAVAASLGTTTSQTVTTTASKVYSLPALTADQTYLVRVKPTINTDEVSASVQNTAGTNIACASDVRSRGTESCQFVAQAGAAYTLVVNNFMQHVDYSVDVYPLENMPTTMQGLTSGQRRFFKATPSVYGKNLMTLQGALPSDNVELKVYSDLFVIPLTCQNQKAAGQVEYCMLDVASGNVYFTVEEKAGGAPTFDVSLSPMTDVALTPLLLNVSGLVTDTVYHVTSLTNATSYTFSFINMDVDVANSFDVLMFVDGQVPACLPAGAPVAVTNATPLDCSLTATPTQEAYILIQPKEGYAATFNVIAN
ncbi:MAG: Ig-like domain-containing protein [Gammaproteobacteria bacterium]|nr:Ig-like domain-containing protein [Gammaproteobacteria bacterium]